jgi:hypothetical protein
MPQPFRFTLDKKLALASLFYLPWPSHTGHRMSALGCLHFVCNISIITTCSDRYQGCRGYRWGEHQWAWPYNCRYVKLEETVAKWLILSTWSELYGYDHRFFIRSNCGLLAIKHYTPHYLECVLHKSRYQFKILDPSWQPGSPHAAYLVTPILEPNRKVFAWGLRQMVHFLPFGPCLSCGALSPAACPTNSCFAT